VSNRLTQLFTEPLLQFLILGGLIYGAYALYGTPKEDYRDTQVIVDANRINAYISGCYACFAQVRLIFR